ncbi:MAG TPA: MFS transporter, partial [Sphingobacteriaceae bacterium]
EIRGAAAVVRSSALIPGSADSLIKTTFSKQFSDGTRYREVKTETRQMATFSQASTSATTVKEVKLSGNSFWTLVLLVTVQVLFVTMVYGPVAAFLVELFPTSIRYTSMSLPYHIGNGVFGGLTPFIAISLTSLPGATPFDGLWYPIGVAAISVIIGMVYIKRNQGFNTIN